MTTSLYILPSQLTIDEDGYVQVHLTDADIESADLIDKYDAEDDRNQYADEREVETEKTTRENLTYEVRQALDSIVRAVEVGRIDDVVSPTDLILHGEAVAIAREALAAALEALGAEEAWIK